MLFAAFAAVIARSLRHGASFECSCFGAGSRLSRATLARATLLASASAVLAVTAAAAGPVADADGFASALVAAVALLATASLLSAIAPLLRWNVDPFGVDELLVEAWGEA